MPALNSPWKNKRWASPVLSKPGPRSDIAAPNQRWQGIGYRHPQAGYFCGIFPQADHVRLLFEFGILLPDPNGLLEGDGKQTRYLTITDVQATPVADMQRLIQAVLALPPSRQAKLALVAARSEEL